MGRVELLHEELSYEIRGILYLVHNHLGSHRSEKQYCDVIEYGFNKRGIKYVREARLPVSFAGEKPGRNRVDFIIEDKIILEIKVVRSLSKNVYHQCTRYLVNADKDLLLLVNFYPNSLFIKRVLNPEKRV